MNYPSVKTLITRLSVDKVTAKKIRQYMRECLPTRALELINGLIPESTSVEYVAGLRYLNMGDTYATTLVFDHKKYRFQVCSWGAIVEAEPRRFDLGDQTL